MVSSRKHSSTLLAAPLPAPLAGMLALLLGLLLGAGALTAPADATIKRTLTLHSSSSIVGSGSWVIFAGKISSSPTGSTVKLQVKVGTTWVDARSLKTTAADGTYKGSLLMPSYLGKYYYRSFAPAGAGRSSATSSTVSVTVLRKVSAAIKPSRTSVDDGGQVTFTGHVSPCSPGSTVTLQRYAGSSWTTAVGAVLTSKCTFTKAVRPTATTSYRLSVPRHGSYAPAYSAVSKITYTPPAPMQPAITTSSLPDAKRGDAYSFALSRTGAAGTWSASNLPNGITLDQSTGLLSGTPIVEGDFAVGLTYTESVSGHAATKQLNLHVNTSPPPSIATTSLADGVKNAAYSQQLSATGNAGAWSAQGLPGGVTLDASTGLISGAPTASDDYVVTLTYTEAAAQTTDSRTLVLHVSPAANSPVITPASLPAATVGIDYAQTLSGTGSGTWSLTKGSFPPGLDFSTNILTPGKIVGSPTTAGDYAFQVKYTTLSGSNTKLYTIHVDPAP